MTDTEAVLRLFDELAGEYDQHIPFFAPFGRDLVAWCGLRPDQRVLDIAAGRGAVTGPAAQAVGPRGAVLAIDGSPNMLRALARDFGDVPQIETREMDAHHLAFPDASFDAVTCGLAFHIMADPGQVIAEAHRVLSEARTEAELTTQAAKREVEDLTRQKDQVTNQLGQMLSGLSGLVPGVGGPAKAAAEPAKAETPAQRTPDGDKNGAGDKPVPAKTNS